MKRKIEDNTNQIEDNITYSKFGQGWEYTIDYKNHYVTLNGNVGDSKATSLGVNGKDFFDAVNGKIPYNGVMFEIIIEDARRTSTNLGALRVEIYAFDKDGRNIDYKWTSLKDFTVKDLDIPVAVQPQDEESDEEEKLLRMRMEADEALALELDAEFQLAKHQGDSNSDEEYDAEFQLLALEQMKRDEVFAKQLQEEELAGIQKRMAKDKDLERELRAKRFEAELQREDDKHHSRPLVESSPRLNGDLLINGSEPKSQFSSQQSCKEEDKPVQKSFLDKVKGMFACCLSSKQKSI